MIVQELFISLKQAVLPNLCTVCGSAAPSNSIFCMRCEYELPRTRYHDDLNNKTSNILAGRFDFDRATSLYYYNSSSFFTRPIFHLKYYKKKHIGIELGRRLGTELLNTKFIETIDCIVPVPLHWEKQRLRGYNQCYMIAEGLSEILSIPIIDTSLMRDKAGFSQTKKNRNQRWDDLQQAFMVKKPEQLSGKHILLVDDIITTGATIEACSTALFNGTENIKISVASIGVAS